MKGKRIVIFSFVVASLIFISGVAMGVTIDKYKADTVSDELRQNQLKIDSYITEQQLISLFKEDKCIVIEDRLSEVSISTSELGNLLNRVSASKSFPMDFDTLKREYIISEAKLFATILELNEVCKKKQNNILFFYKIDHLQSQKQGFVLDDIDDKFNHSITILSFDIEYTKEPLVGLLVKRYNITKAPAVVINNNIIIEGYTKLENIEQNLYP